MRNTSGGPGDRYVTGPDINWPLFWRMPVPVLAGTGIGAVVSKYLPGGVLLRPPAGIRISHRMDESTQFRLFVEYPAVVSVSMLLNR